MHHLDASVEIPPIPERVDSSSVIIKKDNKKKAAAGTKDETFEVIKPKHAAFITRHCD